MCLADVQLFLSSDLLLFSVKPQLSRFLDYQDFFPGPNFVMNIFSHNLDPQPYFTTTVLSEVQVSLLYFQKAKVVLAYIATNEVHSNEFLLA